MSIHLNQICHSQASSMGTHKALDMLTLIININVDGLSVFLFRYYSTLEVLKYQMKLRIYKLLWCVMLLSIMDIADQIFFVCLVLANFQPLLWLCCQIMCSEHILLDIHINTIALTNKVVKLHFLSSSINILEMYTVIKATWWTITDFVSPKANPSSPVLITK